MAPVLYCSVFFHLIAIAQKLISLRINVKDAIENVTRQQNTKAAPKSTATRNYVLIFLCTNILERNYFSKSLLMLIDMRSIKSFKSWCNARFYYYNMLSISDSLFYEQAIDSLDAAVRPWRLPQQNFQNISS